MYPGRFEAVASQWEEKPPEKTEKQIFEELVELTELAEGSLHIHLREVWITVPAITYDTLEKVVRRANELGYLINYITAKGSNVKLYVANEVNTTKVRKFVLGIFWDSYDFSIEVNPLTGKLEVCVRVLFDEMPQNKLLDIIRYVESRVKNVGYSFSGILAENNSIVLLFRKL